MAVYLPVSKVGQTCSPSPQSKRCGMACVHTSALFPLQSSNMGVRSVPCFLALFWSLKSHQQGLDPISVTPRMASGCTMVLSNFLMMLRMWMKKLRLFPKSGHWEILRGRCWPPQDWSSPNHELRDHSAQWCPCGGWGGLVLPLSLHYLQRTALLPPLLLLSEGSGCAFSLPANKERGEFFFFFSISVKTTGAWWPPVPGSLILSASSLRVRAIALLHPDRSFV